MSTEVDRPYVEVRSWLGVSGQQGNSNYMLMMIDVGHQKLRVLFSDSARSL